MSLCSYHLSFLEFSKPVWNSATHCHWSLKAAVVTAQTVPQSPQLSPTLPDSIPTDHTANQQLLVTMKIYRASSLYILTLLCLGETRPADTLSLTPTTTTDGAIRAAETYDPDGIDCRRKRYWDPLCLCEAGNVLGLPCALWPECPECGIECGHCP